MMEDVDAVIANQTLQFQQRAKSADYNTNYHTYDEIVERLQFFAGSFPNVDFIESIGSSYEGRQVAGIRFGKRSSAASPVPTLWFQCQQHAREWITAATCMYMLQHLLEGANGEYADLFDNLQFYLVPMVNPDGFTYSQTRDRLWRKNRRPNHDGTYGVDTNRNWQDGHWGGGGASTVPSSETYRGTGPFSEPETQNVVNYIKKISAEGAEIEAGLDIHSYSQLILRPFGWIGPPTVPANEPRIKKLTADMKAIIASVHGTQFVSEHSAELYIASGGAADWLAANATRQNNGLTLELRDAGRYGFLLPANQIIPTGQEMLPSVVFFAQSALEEVRRREGGL